MSDATEAWEKWNWGTTPVRGWDDDSAERVIFLAGFRAGKVAALTEAADDYSVAYSKVSSEGWLEIDGFLRARAAEVGDDRSGE